MRIFAVSVIYFPKTNTPSIFSDMMAASTGLEAINAVRAKVKEKGIECAEDATAIDVCGIMLGIETQPAESPKPPIKLVKDEPEDGPAHDEPVKGEAGKKDRSLWDILKTVVGD
jgi:hypothetical protein